MKIPFNKPFLTGSESQNISEAHLRGQLAGDGHFTNLCSHWLESYLGSEKVLLTHSCTAALEMAAILCDIKPGDEVIMPSYTFVSTANAFVLRGAVPVFVDISEETMNIDEDQIIHAISGKTKAIVVVHYSGVSCDMDKILDIAETHGLLVVEDAAQGIMASYKGKPLGSMGHFGCFSFHETKNIVSGEGGAISINDPQFVERAEIIREKGTNRSKFFRGEVDKYSWVDIGSSYLPGEIVSAVLWAQLQKADEITNQRMQIWQTYDSQLNLGDGNYMPRKQQIPSYAGHNAHMYYLILPSQKERDEFINLMKQKEIHCVFHYVPLHLTSNTNLNFKKTGMLSNTEEMASRLVRLPLWLGVEQHLSYIIEGCNEIFKTLGQKNLSS